MSRDVTPIPKMAPAVKVPKRMKQRSTSIAERDARYAIERELFLSEHPRCEAEWDGACTRKATEVHHKGGRAASVFFRKAWWLPSCAGCHHRITTNPTEAIERGLSFHTASVA